MQDGTLDLSWDDGRGGSGTLTLGPGDTFTVPKGVARSFHNGAEPHPDGTERVSDDHDGLTRVFVVRGGDSPAMPRMVERAAA